MQQLWRRIRICHSALLRGAQSHFERIFLKFFTWNSLCSDSTPDGFREMESATPPIHPQSCSKLCSQPVFLLQSPAPLAGHGFAFTSCSNCVVWLEPVFALNCVRIVFSFATSLSPPLLGAIDGFPIPRRGSKLHCELSFLYLLAPTYELMSSFICLNFLIKRA